MAYSFMRTLLRSLIFSWCTCLLWSDHFDHVWILRDTRINRKIPPKTELISFIIRLFLQEFICILFSLYSENILKYISAFFGRSISYSITILCWVTTSLIISCSNFSLGDDSINSDINVCCQMAAKPTVWLILCFTR